MDKIIPDGERINPASNKLVIVKNRDVFYAVENIIRCCTINSQTKNYRILNTVNFAIEEINGSPQGTYLYATDFKNLIVCEIPDKLYAKENKIITSSYKFNIIGTIKKVIWCSLHRGLVVLSNDNVVRMYKFENPNPILTVDLNDQVKESVTSISFGSNDNLIGSMTLYITTSSKVYAIYPFLPEDIDTDVESIDLAIKETNELLKYVSSLYERDDLIKSIEDQLNLLKFMKDEGKVKSNLNKPCVQGPLIDLEMKINDISLIGSNKNVSMLAVVGNEDTTIKYLSQLKPLVMKFENSSSLVSHIYGNEIITKDVHEHYEKPSQGFGYIDDSESDDEEEEFHFWKNNFISIDLLTTDILNETIKDPKIILTDKLLIKGSNGSVIMSNDWIKMFYNYLSYDIVNCYQFITQTESIALISDDITFTGDYVITINNDKPELNKISEPEIINDKLILKDTVIEVKNDRPQDTLIEQIEAMTKSLTNINIDTINDKDDDLSLLKKVNSFSVDSIKKIVQYSKILITLNYKVTNEIKELTNQVHLLEDIKVIEISDEKLKKLDTLKSRQKDLSVRLKKLHSKLTNKIEEIKIQKNVPLSNTEQAWVQEIEVLTKNDPSKNIKDLENQVNLIKSKFNQRLESKISVKELALLKNIFKDQSDRLNGLKNSFESLISDVNA